MEHPRDSPVEQDRAQNCEAAGRGHGVPEVGFLDQPGHESAAFGAGRARRRLQKAGIQECYSGRENSEKGWLVLGNCPPPAGLPSSHHLRDAHRPVLVPSASPGRQGREPPCEVSGSAIHTVSAPARLRL